MNQDHTQQGSSKEQKIFVIVGVIFILAGIIASSVGIKLFWEGYRAKNWPTADGVIISSGTRWQHPVSGGNPTLIAEVVYQYNVDGKLFRNNRISANQFGSNSPEHAKSEARAYPEQTTVTVYYNPAEPSQSYLQPGWGWINLIALVVGIVAAMAAFFLLRQGVQNKESRNKIHEKTSRSSYTHLPPQNNIRKYQRLMATLTAGLALAVGLLMTMYRIDSKHQRVVESEVFRPSEESTRMDTTLMVANDTEIAVILMHYVSAQKDYKSMVGQYTKDLQELVLPNTYQPEPLANGNVEISGYTFSHVELNGATAMDYQQDFVICAIPTVNLSADSKSFAVGPKGIVIFGNNNGKAVNNRHGAEV